MGVTVAVLELTIAPQSFARTLQTTHRREKAKTQRG